MDAPWPVEWQTGYTHEILHLLGAGYHSNMLQCLNPGVDQRDVLSCANAEYTDYYDLLGSSNGWAPNLNARSRYHFGWLGADDVIAVRYRGTHAIAPLNSDPAAAGIFAQRAAVIPSLDLWLEWRTEAQAMDTGADGGGVFARNDGLFMRRHNTMIDADLQSCAPLTEEQWKGEDEWESPMARVGRSGGSRSAPTARSCSARWARSYRTPASWTRTPPSRRWGSPSTSPAKRRRASARRRASRRASSGSGNSSSAAATSGVLDATIALLDALPESYASGRRAKGRENNDAAGCAARTQRQSPEKRARQQPPTSRRSAFGGGSFVAPAPAFAPGGLQLSVGFGCGGSRTTPPTATTTSSSSASTSSGMRSPTAWSSSA